MDAAFAWLSELIYAVAKILPRRVIVQATHQLLVYKRGRHVRVKNPGVRWYWPFWTKVQLWPVVRQRVITEQRIEEKGGQTVWVKAVVLYRVKDLKVFLTKNYEPDDMMGEIAEAGVKEAVNEHTIEYIRSYGIDDELLKKVRMSCRSMGVMVLRARLTEFCPTVVYSLTGITGALVPPASDEEEE